MMKKLEVPSTCGRAEQQLHRASYVKINSKKTKDLKRPELLKLLRKTEMLPKTEKGKGLLFCFIQYPEVQKT